MMKLYIKEFQVEYLSILVGVKTFIPVFLAPSNNVSIGSSVIDKPSFFLKCYAHLLLCQTTHVSI